MNLSEIQLSLLNKNFQNLLQLLHKILTLEKLLLSQRGQTMKLLSVKKKHHCSSTAKPRILSVSQRQNKDTPEEFCEGCPPHLYYH